MQPRITDLVAAIRQAMPTFPAKVGGRGLTSRWPAPPLLNLGKLGDVDLTPFACFYPPYNVSQVREVYEDFVADYIAAREVRRIPQGYLAEKLDQPMKLMGWLFPRRIRDRRHHLAVLLLMISRAYDLPIQIGHNTILVTAPSGAKFGVDDGTLRASFTQASLGEYDYAGALANHSTLVDASECSDDTLSMFYRHAMQIKDEALRKQVVLALRLIFVRLDEEDRGQLSRYLYAGVTYRQPNGIRKRRVISALRKEIEGMPNPMPRIYEALVESDFMDAERFEEIFTQQDIAYRHKPEAHTPPEVLLDWHKKLKIIGVIK